MNIAQAVEQTIKDEIKQAVLKSGLAEEALIPEIILETPREKAHGDYSTNIAMQLARVAKKRHAKLQKVLLSILQRKKYMLKKLKLLVQAL